MVYYITDYLEDEGIDPYEPWDDIDWDDLDLYINITWPGSMPDTGDKVIHISPSMGNHIMDLDIIDANFEEWPLSKLDERFFRAAIKAIF